MTDIIWGTVKTILDPNSFKISLTHRKDSNENNYDDIEKIRFSETDIVTIPADPNQRTKEVVEQNLKDVFVKCEISNRDSEGYLVAKVSHSGQHEILPVRGKLPRITLGLFVAFSDRFQKAVM